jgi:alanine racemase
MDCRPTDHDCRPFARIDLDALASNARRIQRKVKPRGLLAVIKWDAYGHGLIPCAQTLDCAGAAGFGVSSPQDGVLLRKAGITKPILVMTDWVGKPPSLFLDWELEAAATSWYKIEYLEAVSRKMGRPIPAHVKFDTGLGRVGIHHSEYRTALQAIARMRNLQVVGLYSHLGYSGPQDEIRGRKQIELFEKIVRAAERLDLTPRWIHLANSAAAMAIPDVPGNLVRTGIALYGQPPSEEVDSLLPLNPVMTLIGQVRAVRRIRRGHGFPHPHFWNAPTDGWGAEVNLGFASSYPRSLAGKTHVLFRGKRCPLVGLVSRDCCYVFTGSDKPEIGEEVVFWGRQSRSILHLYELSSLIGALPYELPTWLSPSVERVFTTRSNSKKPRSSVYKAA